MARAGVSRGALAGTVNPAARCLIRERGRSVLCVAPGPALPFEPLEAS